MNFKELWKFRYDEPILGIELGDINNDGELEVIAYTKVGRLLILSLNGSILHQEVISKDTPIWHLKVYDIDNDEKNELILGGMDGILRAFKCKLNYDLLNTWNHKFNSSISGIIINDINNDNKNELIVYSLDKTIRVLNSSNGHLIWGQVFEDGVGDAIIFRNEQKLILACGNDGTLRSYNGVDGNLLWFKRYSNKMRCVSYLNSNKGCVVLCGGDDKKLHIIDKRTQKEIMTKEFKDYIWKCKTYPFPTFNKIIVSSYSFDYFNNSIPLDNLSFSSKLICLNEFLDVTWELKGYNIEFLKIIEFYNENIISAGTTKGELILIEEQTGKILLNKKHKSCLNMIQFVMEKQLLISCHDNGTVVAYEIGDLLNRN